MRTRKFASEIDRPLLRNTNLPVCMYQTILRGCMVGMVGLNGWGLSMVTGHFRRWGMLEAHCMGCMGSYGRLMQAEAGRDGRVKRHCCWGYHLGWGLEKGGQLESPRGCKMVKLLAGR